MILGDCFGPFLAFWTPIRVIWVPFGLLGAQPPDVSYLHMGRNPKIQIWKIFGVDRGNSGPLFGSVFGLLGPHCGHLGPDLDHLGPNWSKMPLTNGYKRAIAPNAALSGMFDLLTRMEVPTGRTVQATRNDPHAHAIAPGLVDGGRGHITALQHGHPRCWPLPCRAAWQALHTFDRQHEEGPWG